MGMTKIASAVATATNGSTFDWPGGDGAMIAAGTFGALTVTLHASPDDGTTFVATAAALSAAGVATFSLPPCKVRAVTTGTPSSPSLNAWIGKNTPSVR